MDVSGLVAMISDRRRHRLVLLVLASMLLIGHGIGMPAGTSGCRRLRFMTPTQAAVELNVKPNQIHALIKAGELRALQVGGRGMWRVGRQDLEDYINEAYRRTAERIAAGDISDDGDAGDAE